MNRLIEQRTDKERNIKNKLKELNEIKNTIEEINNTHFLEMTFDKYKNKTLLDEYYHNQYLKLSEYINGVRFNQLDGNLIESLIKHFREQADNCIHVMESFKEFESNPDSKELENSYRETFNNKVDGLHLEALELLTEYFALVGEDETRIFKLKLKGKLPAPITTVDIETNMESKRRGIPYDYGNRKRSRKK